MSFSARVKEELLRYIPKARHCQIAELAAIIILCGRVSISETGRFHLFIHTENIYAVKRFYQLIKEIFGIFGEISIKTSKKGEIFTLLFRDEETKKILKSIKFITEENEVRDDYSLVSGIVIQNSCCKEAFIRAAFLVSGSIGDPNKGYQFEIVTKSETDASRLVEILKDVGIIGKFVRRKHSYPVYLRDSEGLIEFLRLAKAHLSLMELENIRIYKEVKNNVNRNVNCEMANIKKTATASAKQLDNIYFLERIGRLEKLPNKLLEIAKLRLEYPDASLKELGEKLNPPIGKSGVNHRLNKIEEIAETERKL